METRDRRRVVLRANGKRRHLDVSAGAGDRETSRGSQRAAHILSDVATPPCRPAQQTHHSDTCSQPSHTPHSPPTTAAAAAARERSSKIFHSTPLHLPPIPHWRAELRQTRPPQFPSFRDSTPSSSSSSSLADAPREQPISGDQMLNKAQKLHTSSSSVGKPVSGASTQKGRLGQDMRASSKTRQRRKKRSRVHPEPQASVDSSPQVHAPSPPIPPAWSPQSSSYSVPEQPALDCSGALNCSLPPLLSARLRKGGRRPSASVDWSSDGAAELRRCLPDQQLRVFVGTWNMQELSVSGWSCSACISLSSPSHSPHPSPSGSSRLSGPIPAAHLTRGGLRALRGGHAGEHEPSAGLGGAPAADARPLPRPRPLRLPRGAPPPHVPPERPALVLLRGAVGWPRHEAGEDDQDQRRRWYQLLSLRDLLSLHHISPHR